MRAGVEIAIVFRKIQLVVLTAAVLASAAGTALGQQSQPQESDGQWRGPFSSDAKWGPFLDIVGAVGTKRSLGQLDLFVPLAQDERTLLFGDARFTADDLDSLEGNIGLGARRMLGGGWNVGGYGYFDRRRTSTWNTFNQLTFGAEALGTNFDFRANSYLPVGETAKVVSASTSTGFTGAGTPTFSLSGNNLLVNFPGTQSTTTAIYEYALAGFDAEAGVRVPVFDTKGPYDLRFYAGGYRFADGVTPVIAGPRLRLELTNYRIPELWGGTRFTVGAEYQYDDVRGSQAFASFRLRVPLQAETRRGSLNYQERRMTDPIVRDIDVVAQRGTVTSTSPGIAASTEQAVATAAGSTLAVANAAVATPAQMQTIVTGAGANSTVVMQGSFATASLTTLQAGQTMIGSGSMSVRTSSGRSATATLPGQGVISRTVAVSGQSVLALANNSTLSGMNLQMTSSSLGGTANTVLSADGINGATISNNTLSASSSASTPAIAVLLTNSSNLVFSGNSVAGNGSGGGARGLSLGSVTSSTFSGNTIRASETTGAATALFVLNSSATFSGNSLDPATTGGGSQFGVVINNSNVTGSTNTNVLVGGSCVSLGANTGSIGFTNGTTCP